MYTATIAYAAARLDVERSANMRPFLPRSLACLLVAGPRSSEEQAASRNGKRNVPELEGVASKSPFTIRQSNLTRSLKIR